MLDFQKNLRPSFYAMLSLPATAMGFGLCIQIATLSWILNTKYGFDIHEVGLVWLAGPLAGILGQVIIGVISDKTWFWGGRRRPFIWIGGVLATMMVLALPNIHHINNFLGIGSLIATATVVAVLLDLAINVSFNPTRSLIADVTPQGEARTKGYTWMQTISGFFGVLAYLIGAFVSNYFLIYAGAVFVLLAAVIPPFFIEEPRQLEDPAPAEGLTTEEGSTWPRFLKIGFSHAFTWIGVQTMFIYTFAYIKEVIMGFPTTQALSEAQNNDIGTRIGIAFAILNTVGFLVPTLLLEPLARRFGRVRTHVLALLTMVIGYTCIVFFGKSVAAFYIFMALVGIGWGSVVSLPFAILSESVTQKKMGLFMGLFNLFVVIPQFISSGLGKFIGNQPDKSMIFIISAVTLAISAIAWALLVKSNPVLKKV
jgi:maltose/moltooligosaccharide transporter